MDGTTFDRVARAIRFLADAGDARPSLGEVAAHVGLSPFHFQRLFQAQAGLSPKRFAQYLALRRAKAALDAGAPALDAAFAAGLSGPGRLHDLFRSLERLTPGEYRRRAAGLTVRWGVEATPLGPALLATLDRGLCGIAFLGEGGAPEAVAALRRRWPRATLAHAPASVRSAGLALRARLAGRPHRPLGIVLKGTDLQLRTWEALLAVPEGRTLSYGALARAVGAPGAARAVGTAVGQNPLAVLIPCHRVIRESGALGGYAWGLERKLALLAREQAT